MIWKRNKIRDLEKKLMATPPDENVRPVLDGIMAESPPVADPQFRETLKNKLLAKHQAMTNNKPAKQEVEKMEKKSFWSDFRVRGWATALGALVLVALVGVIAYPLIPAPTVRGYVLRGSIREVSLNAPLKITFDQLMDNASVEKSFKIEPATEGKLEWQGNSLLFRPASDLRLGDVFTVTIGTGAKSLLQKSLTSEYSEVYKVVAAPKVLLLTPNDGATDVPADSQINIMFDRPLSALTTLQSGREDFPKIIIEPAVNGRFKWLGTSTLQFLPEKLALATSYKVTVPKGTPVLDGGFTEEEFSTTFETARPQAIMMTTLDTLTADQVSPRSNFVIAFNQKVDLTSAKEIIKLQLTENEQITPENISVRYYTLEDWKAEQKRAMELQEMDQYEEIIDATKEAVDTANDQVPMESLDAPTAEELQKSLVITPAQALKENSNYLLTVRSGLKGAEGPLTTANDENYTFRTLAGFNFVSVYNDGELGSYVLARPVLSYNNRVDLRSLRGRIHFSPERKTADGTPELPRVYSTEFGSVAIDYNFLPSTAYTLTVDPGVKDILGNSYDQKTELAFTSNAFQPEMKLESGTDMSVLDAYQGSHFYIKSVNADFVDIKLKKLTQEQFASAYAYGYMDYSNVELSKYGETDFEGRLAIELGFNNNGHTLLDLDKLTGKKLESGFYLMQISNPNIKTSVCRYEWETTTPGCEEVVKVEKVMFLITGTSLSLKTTLNEAMVWATDLRDGKPVSGEKILIYNREQAKVAEGETDVDGVARIKLPANSGDYYADYLVYGQRGGDLTFAHTSWSEGIAPWNFNINSEPLAPRYYMYLYTDRPIYRPAQEVYFKGIVRQEEGYKFKLPDVKKVKVTINDSEGNKIHEEEIALGNNGTFSGKMTLGANIPTGDFSIQAELLEASGPEWMNNFHAAFKVYEYRKPEYKLDLTGDKTDYINGDKARVNVEAAYFFGAPLPKAEVNWTLKSQDYYFILPEDIAAKLAGSWFSFAEEGYFCYWGCQSGSEVVSQGKVTTDDAGKAQIELPLDITDKKMSQIYTLEVTAADANHQSVSNRLSFPVHQGEFYLGIRSNDYIVGTDKPAKFDVLAVEKEGRQLAGKKVEVTLFERNWNTVKRKNVDGDFYFENSYEDKQVDQKSVTTGEDGLAGVEFAIAKGGVYKVQAKAMDGRGNQIFSSTTVYVSSGEFINWGSDNNDKIELVTDKMEYKVGDTAKILVKSPYKDVYALVTYEKDKVLDYKVIKLKSNSDTIEVPITEKFLPNAFVSVVLIKGDAYDAGLVAPAEGAPDERKVAAFKVGYTTLQVDTESKKLQIEVSSDKQKYAPGEKVTLRFKTADYANKALPAELSVAVVDESVLSLTESVTADLLNVFYRQRLLGVSIAETLTKAISRVNVQVEAGMKGGGGGELATRGIFKDTAEFEAVLKTDANGVGTVEFTLPDNLTTWQVMAIGISDDTQKAQTLVGSNKYSFLVTKDILVRPVLPRFLTVNDEMKVSALVHNYTAEEQSIAVKMETSGVEMRDGAEKTVRVASQGSKQVDWLIKVGAEGEAKFTFTAVANGGERGDSIEQTLPVQEDSMPETVALGKVISGEAEELEQVWLPQGLAVNKGSLKISVAATLAGVVTEGLHYVVNYPYGCTEQLASSILPSIAAKRLLSTGKIQLKDLSTEEVDRFVNSGLQQIYKNQQSHGGFGLWINSSSNVYLTSYVTMTMYEAKSAGYTVDQGVFDGALKFIKDFLNQKPDPAEDLAYRLNTRAYALYVLGLAGQGDLGLLNNLYDQREMLSLLSRAYLMMAFNQFAAEDGADAGTVAKVETLKKDLENAALQTPRGVAFQEKSLNYTLFDTNTRSTAIILQALNQVDAENPLVPKIVQALLRERQGGHFSTTQETAVSLLALIHYLESANELSPAYEALVDVNGKNIIDTSFTSKNLFEHKEVSVPLKDLLPNNLNNEVAARKEGDGRMYFDMNLQYYLPLVDLQPENEGIEVLQDYYAVTDQKMENPLSSVAVGQNVHGRLTIIVPEDRHYVMIEDFLPAGLEGIDFNLKTSDQTLQEIGTDECLEGCYNNWYFNHSEVRDDRMMYFADFLPQGIYELDYYLRATSVGRFADLPVLAQETYFPEVFGRSGGKYFTISE